jgi:hypothetical protein
MVMVLSSYNPSWDTLYIFWYSTCYPFSSKEKEIEFIEWVFEYFENRQYKQHDNIRLTNIKPSAEMMRLCVNAQDIPTQYESNRVYLRFTIQI